MNLRIASIAITPPGYKASGGVSAARQLMAQVALREETHLLIMGEEARNERIGALEEHTVTASNWLKSVSGLKSGRVLTPFWTADFAAWLRKIQPHIVHLHNPHPPGALLKAARACTSADIPFVISTHGFVEYDDFSRSYGAPWWQKPIINQVIRRPLVGSVKSASGIFMLSPYERPIFSRMGIEDCRLDVITNGINPDFLQPFGCTELDQHLARFQLPIDRPFAFFVGNHTRNKGIDVLLKAGKLLNDDTLIVVGGGKGNDVEHRALLNSAGITDSDKRFLFTGFLSENELRAFYQRCDTFVFPSRADTLPLVVLEAMASGTPVIATRVGGIPYQVTDDTGILVEAGDHIALADAITTLTTDPERCQRMGAAARTHVQKMFSWEKSAELAIESYRRILNQ